MIDQPTPTCPILTPKSEFFECLLDSFPGRLVVKDLEGRYRYMNNSQPYNAGGVEYKAQTRNRSWFGQTDVEFYNDYETARRVREADQRCIRTGQPVITTVSTSQQTIHFPLVQPCTQTDDSDRPLSEIVGVCGLTLDVAGSNESNINTNMGEVEGCGDSDSETQRARIPTPPPSPPVERFESFSSTETASSSSSSPKSCSRLVRSSGIPSLEGCCIGPIANLHTADHITNGAQVSDLCSEKEEGISGEKLRECERSESKSSAQVEENDYRNIVKNIDTAVALCEVLTDDQGKPINFRYIQVNPAFSRLFGIPRNEIRGKLFTEVFPGIENDEANWIEKFSSAAFTGVSANFVQFSDCMNKWYSGVAYRPFPDNNRRFNIHFIDYSEQFHSQEALRESQERHKNLFESMVQGVVYQDLKGTIIAANPAAERILGLSYDQMVGRTSVDPRWKATHEDGTDFPGYEHPAMVAIKTGNPVINVHMGVFHPKQEAHHWIKIDSIPRFKPGETTPYQVCTTFTDITDMVRFEKELLRAKEKAEGADRLKSAFLANMSHEIRTPLNGIIGHIDLALANGLAPSFRDENLDGLRIARSSGELLISIIQDILDLSKIEAGQLAVQDTEFSLYALADHSADIARTLIKARKSNVTFTASVDPAISDSQTGDSFRIQQVVNNLLSNATKFTSEGKIEFNIKIIEENGNTMLEFSVLDTGKGIPNSHLRTIFEPFRQVDYSDTRQHGGTGLGLTISQKLVELMQGQLRVESSVFGPMRGSFFAFTIPYRPCHSEKQPEAGADVNYITRRKSLSDFLDPPAYGEDNEATADPPFVFTGKILVAEDDPISRRLVHRMLQITTGLSSNDILLACDGEEAVALYRSNFKNIAMILMDVQMPKLDGLQATKYIRDLEALRKRTDPNAKNQPQVPIVALSAGAMKGDQERGLAVGMSDYLTKPVNFKSLAQTLERFWGQGVSTGQCIAGAEKPLSLVYGKSTRIAPLPMAHETS